MTNLRVIYNNNISKIIKNVWVRIINYLPEFFLEAHNIFNLNYKNNQNNVECFVENKENFFIFESKNFLVEINNKNNQNNPWKHYYHLVNPSPWPFVLAFNLFLIILSIVVIFHYNNNVSLELFFGFFGLILCLFSWWRDVIRESTYEIIHTTLVRKGLLIGMILFIISEIFLFFGFFWAFFHASLTPASAIGSIWPPIFLEPIDAFKLPLVNTITLIISGFTLTIAHKQLKGVPIADTFKRIELLEQITIWLFITICFGLFFLFCQIFEYYFANFTFKDTIYGTTFYSLTGLHGIHVFVGTIFLIVCFFRSLIVHFLSSKQVGFKCSVWYWHFVDIVWILLFFTVYIWGGAIRSA